MLAQNRVTEEASEHKKKGMPKIFGRTTDARMGRTDLRGAENERTKKNSYVF